MDIEDFLSAGREAGRVKRGHVWVEQLMSAGTTAGKDDRGPRLKAGQSSRCVHLWACRERDYRADGLVVDEPSASSRSPSADPHPMNPIRRTSHAARRIVRGAGVIAIAAAVQGCGASAAKPASADAAT